MKTGTGASERHAELAIKIQSLGKALVKEGVDNKDKRTAKFGNCLLLAGSLMFDEKDVILFGELCNMMNSKKLIDNEMKKEVVKKTFGQDLYDGSLVNKKGNDIFDIINQLDDRIKNQKWDKED